LADAENFRFYVGREIPRRLNDKKRVLPFAYPAAIISYAPMAGAAVERFNFFRSKPRTLHLHDALSHPEIAGFDSPPKSRRMAVIRKCFINIRWRSVTTPNIARSSAFAFHSRAIQAARLRACRE
jgi:hypothetical protein